MILSHRPSCGLDVEKKGGRTLTSNNVGRLSFLRGPPLRPTPPGPSSVGDSSTPAAMASSSRRRKRRRRKMPRMMIADEMASKRNNVARKVNLITVGRSAESYVPANDIRRSITRKKVAQTTPGMPGRWRPRHCPWWATGRRRSR
ncbi:hypothetical protein BD414DRAFT_115376 [Trametes punicea]|nr:hypothetical protein BD414DRAFT_115376 [Trametes punicea]